MTELKLTINRIRLIIVFFKYLMDTIKSGSFSGRKMSRF